MLSLTKEPIQLSKASASRARVYWPAQTDYDLGAEVVYEDGHTESLANFPAAGVPAQRQTKDGRVRLSADAGRGGGTSEETLDVDLTGDGGGIVAVIPWAYSAQSNGAGSFHQYRVGMEVTNGSTVIGVTADSASRNPVVYTEIIAMFTNLPGEGPRLVKTEHHSGMGSESRPMAGYVPAHTETRTVRKGFRKELEEVAVPAGIVINMDGPRNAYK